ncbi:MAG: DUF1801 domain-containing protein [Lactobacillus sp.]|jgi:uncharacterized protein YdhG (YjbR/CyaY superfamily)|nr:DUF1801 domain-containing protein [Lactobacillus sp.]MCI2031996.1 DUF1801 domain-containing protein [Lactobacillus sp.]
MTVITTYIAHQPALAQPHLKTIYAVLKVALPQATEKISYGMPTFWQGQAVVYFGANKQHLGFYPTPAPIAAFADQLKGYRTSKGAIQFPYAEPLPTALITAIAQWRLAQLP